jgi:hypothetical protein
VGESSDSQLAVIVRRNPSAHKAANDRKRMKASLVIRTPTCKTNTPKDACRMSIAKTNKIDDRFNGS